MKISIKDQAPGPNPNFERNFKLCRFSTDWLLKNELKGVCEFESQHRIQD